MKCKGCGSNLTLIEYQSRSADEAHSSVYRCPLCPLDIVKFSNLIPKSHLYLRRSKRQRKKTPSIDCALSYTSVILYVVSKTLSIVQGCKFLDAMSSNCIGENSKLFKRYSSGPWKSMAISHEDRRNIGLNAYTATVSIVPVNPQDGQEYSDFKYTTIEGYTVILQDDQITLMCDVGMDSESAILEHLSTAYTIGFAPTSLVPYVTGVFLGAMSNMNARAYDAVSGEDHKDKFSTKPDGERMWLVRAGSTWLYCKRLDFDIRTWEIDNKLQYTDSHPISPVIDIEFMLTFDPILIDVILDNNGKICPYDRNLNWIQEQMYDLRKRFEYLSVVQAREFFDTYDEAQLYCKGVKYPTDGLIAISSHGTDMKKLKPLKSMELRLQEDRQLVTREGTALFKMTADSIYSVGDIVEIRFSIVDNNLKVWETFYRPDKVLPNDNSAVQAIIASCTKPDSNSVLRTMMWRWSNRLRFYLYEKANFMLNDRNIILDIGSGSGQSTEAFDKVPGCSFILIEPNEAACKSLSRRLGIRDVHKDPRSVIGVIPQLKRGVRKYHILNCTLETLLADKPVVSNIKSIVKCAVSCFSAHYIANKIDDLVLLGIPFVGCYYSYDKIAVGESIVDESGIKMTRTSLENATVKWGKDEAYDEPVVLSEDEPMRVAIIDALDVIALDNISHTTTVYKVCSHVKVLISK